MTKVAAFDVATCTGVCIGAGGEIPRLSHFVFRSDGANYGVLYRDARRKFWKLLTEEKPDEVWAESPIGNNTIHVARVLLGLLAHLEEICDKLNIPYYEVDNGKGKAALSRHGKAQKVHQVAAARLLGFNPIVHDEADALGLWLCAISVRAPAAYAFWREKQNTLPYQRLINSCGSDYKLRLEASKRKAAQSPQLKQDKSRNGKRKKSGKVVRSEPPNQSRLL